MRWIEMGMVVGSLALAGCPDDVTTPADTDGSSGESSGSTSVGQMTAASMSETSNGSSSGQADSTGDAGSSTGSTGGASSSGGSSSTGGSSGSSGSTSDASSGSTAGTTTDSSGTTDDSTTGTDTGFETTSGTTGDPSTGSSGFVESSSDTSPLLDVGVPIVCDLFAQNCPVGEKCMPFDEDLSGTWNATGCFPIDDNPDQVGDECDVTGSGVSGVDTCDGGAMCFDVDAMTLTGTCVEMCGGSLANPICTDPDTSCAIANDGFIILCLATCDPLMQDCNNGGCYPIGDGFNCAPEGTGAQGDPCANINGCDPSLMCISAAAYGAGCAAAACCTSFCDVDMGDTCPVGAQECLNYYAPGSAPPGFETVGVCAEPI